MKKILLLLLITSQFLLALVSIVPVDIGDKPGLHGVVSSTLETKKGNTDKENYKFSTRVTYDSNTSYVTWGELSRTYGESNGIEDVNKYYFHLRHIHAITQESFCSEIYLQTQEDIFKLIKVRSLAGAGIRYKIFEVFNGGKGYLGLGGFYEHVNYTDTVNPEEENVRFNAYFAYTIKLTEDSDLSYSLFYQPRYDRLHDYVTSHKVSMELLVYKALYLNFSASWDIDNEPAIGVKDSDFSQETTFVLKF